MTQEEKKQKTEQLNKMLSDAGITGALVFEPLPGCTLNARLAPDGAIMCQTVEGGEREIELCDADNK